MPRFNPTVTSLADVPSFLDPHVPVVAREILQKMIKQFAAEYTSKTSSPQDSCSDPQISSDQSLPTTPFLPDDPPTSPAASLAGPKHNLNPVLSKLLMADQDAPLDLTIKKPQSEPSEQGSMKASTSVAAIWMSMGQSDFLPAFFNRGSPRLVYQKESL